MTTCSASWAGRRSDALPPSAGTTAWTPQDARTLFENVWIYTFGIGALCATRVCRFSPEQLGQMLTTEFQAMLLLVKSGKLRNKEEDR